MASNRPVESVESTAGLLRPSLMLYGGTIASGRSCKGEDLDIVSTFEAVLFGSVHAHLVFS